MCSNVKTDFLLFPFFCSVSVSFLAIKRQLQRSNDAIVKRITSLLPWLHGKLSLRPSSALGTVDEDEVNVPTNEGEAGKAKRISM